MWFSAQNISFSHDQKKILQHLDLELEAGKIYAVLGANGVGKSTLLRILAGLLDPDEGTIYLEQEEILGPAFRLVPGYRTISLVKQDSRLHPLHTVEENLNYVLRAYDLDFQAAKIKELATLLDLGKNWKRQVKNLSGGEQQRVAIAAALANQPSLLLLDEPFSQTDMLVKQELRHYMSQIVEQLGISILFVSHDSQEALSLAHHLFVLHEGRMIESGENKRLYYRPLHTETATLTGLCNWIPINLLPSHSSLHKVEDFFLVRPEQVVLVKENEEGHEAEIRRITFFGIYHLVTFSVSAFPNEILGAFLTTHSLIPKTVVKIALLAPPY